MPGRQEFASDDLPTEMIAFRQIVYLAQVLRYLFDRRLGDDGLSTAQAMALTAAQRPNGSGPPSLTELAADLATSHQNVAVLLRSLTDRGFVRIEPDPDDRRVRRVVVTDECRAYFAGRDDADLAFLERLFTALSEEELRVLVALLDRVLASATISYRALR